MQREGAEMNPRAVYAFFAETLHTNVALIRPGREMEITGSLSDPFLRSEILIGGVMACAAAEKPAVCCVNDHYYYGAVIHDSSAVFIGPVFSPSGIRPGNGLIFSIEAEHPPVLPAGSLTALLEAVRTVHNLLNDADLSFGRLLHLNFYQEKLGEELNNRMNGILFSYSESNENHGSYANERRLTHAIRTGDMKLVMEASMENIHGKHGTVHQDELQNSKNLSIAGITIASRAAIEGGLQFEIALSLTDSYLQQISKSETTDEIASIVFQCNEHLARLVSERRRQDKQSAGKSSAYYSEKAKEYVISHLHEALSVQSIADSLKISPNYLSALFRKNEGISLTRYILQEKISQARGMLLYSTMPYSEIAMYLGFSSQSHFCKVFRQFTALSPSEFRRNLT